MNSIVHHLTKKEKLRELFFQVTVGNFIGFVAGSLVSTFSTYRVYESKGVRNLFGILPRHKIEVHMLPEWAETVLAIVVGFIVMQVVSYYINNKIHIIIWNKLKGNTSEKNKINPA